MNYQHHFPVKAPWRLRDERFYRIEAAASLAVTIICMAAALYVLAVLANFIE